MARGMGEATITLSVLDRLIDREPELSQEPGMSRAQSIRILRAAVRRDLESLLNTRRIAMPVSYTHLTLPTTERV